MIDVIALESVLPQVFCGMEGDERIGRSQVWLTPLLEFRRGERVCIAAESGGGKSSLLSFIYGNRRDYIGNIYFDGVDIKNNSIDKWCALRSTCLALLPQEMRLFPELTVWENIAIKNRLTRHKSRAEIVALLERLGVADKLNVPCARLSVGQQQRVAIVRTVCQPFDFILLDEPVSHLDEQNNREVAHVITEEAVANGAGIMTTSVGNHLLLEEAQIISL